jgi:hypothetical protein
VQKYAPLLKSGDQVWSGGVPKMDPLRTF